MAASSSHTPPTARTAVEDPRYFFPSFLPKPGSMEILEKFRLFLAHYLLLDSLSRTGVNTDLSMRDPWDLPELMVREEEAMTREKYFLTDYPALRSMHTSRAPATKTGYWKPRNNLGWGIATEGVGQQGGRFAGLKMTYDFHAGDTIYEEGSKRTNWIMDVYFLIDQKTELVEDDLVMCHVFECNSRDYNPRPRCAGHLDQSHKGKGSAGLLPSRINKPLATPDNPPQPRPGCVYPNQASKENGEPSYQAIHGQNNNPQLLVTDSELQPVPLSPSFSRFCCENLEDIMDSDSMEIENCKHNGVPSTALASGENNGQQNEGLAANALASAQNNGQQNEGVPSTAFASAQNLPRKRGRPSTKSRAWVQFTRYSMKGNRKVVVAICKHCRIVMTGSSKNGTNHLNNHNCRCHCNQLPSRAQELHVSHKEPCF
ncbi:unnamed protein product [Urochloa humidicola]